MTLNTINGVVVSFECKSTLSSKTLELPVVILVKSQYPIKVWFIQLTPSQYKKIPSFKLSACPPSNVQGDFGHT